MTLADLIATREDFGVEAPFMAKMLERYNREDTFSPATTIDEMFLVEARRALVAELPVYIGMPTDWWGYDQSIGRDADVPSWRHLISRKQLELFYDWLPEGEGSENDRRRKRYEAQWRAALDGLKSIINGSGGTEVTRTMRVRL